MQFGGRHIGIPTPVTAKTAYTTYEEAVIARIQRLGVMFDKRVVDHGMRSHTVPNEYEVNSKEWWGEMKDGWGFGPKEENVRLADAVRDAFLEQTDWVVSVKEFYPGKRLDVRPEFIFIFAYPETK